MASLDQLKHILGETLSPDANVRRNGKLISDLRNHGYLFTLFFCPHQIFSAEKNLHEAQKLQGHPLQVLQLVANAPPNEAAIQQAAAVHFKNVVKKGWDCVPEVRFLFVLLSRDLER